ncbi:MAG: glycosyltransferase [Pseudodesulfovibrio sp.]|uniref:Glycosyl transferase group 1 n=1 Tax=Pseudodesulfovibrio aespoeensis (strain ATCC 700646 / DSM 10631 / Aspo-2) TaxID=643562 RepID=E6W004_PSEA9|nr:MULTISPECIES: glycosyltransferase [Pseudodesulfovibrio]MBU4242859.1 glycosyltransferase [Pseudomonadota bacterium]ADU64086.1 glycosyl transferase group 1 [Pseudodesulfovibrio aespoeensis Aspo-2]MBU4379943.1 glycosyltransferase [Pseudomonadota bacterium]MBU4476006.1 glycosyltransferase [Pseudomonadota bacterium]MBU4517376.1 glycosyltransferase [Pseudomonadota bacterium]
MADSRFRVDMHVHSKFSTRPSQWLLQKIGCPESFTEPATLYAIARERGMDLVTITDHNTISGSLEIAGLPGTFVSEEITTYFPEDRCKLHVLAYDITEAQHEDIQHVRENVFDLVGYLRGQDITHVLAHPLFAVNDRLTPAHFEQSLLLFDVFEENGTRDARQNQVLRDILARLTLTDMERLANTHGIAPHGQTPWRKGLIGGSDDHSSLNIARMHTTFAGTASVKAALAGVRDHSARPGGSSATPRTMAHNLYGIGYGFYRSRIGAMSHAASEHLCFRFVKHALSPDRTGGGSLVDRFLRLIGRGKASLHREYGPSKSVQDMLLKEAGDIIAGDPDLMRIAKGEIIDILTLEREWSRFVSLAANRVLAQFADRTLNAALGANLFDVFHSIGSAGSLYALLAPYFVGYDLFASERKFSRECLARFRPKAGKRDAKNLKIAHFTDTFDEINGVARTIRQQLAMVARHGKDMTVITCGASADIPGAVSFAPVGRFSIPEYPGIELAYPPFLDMLTHCFEQEYDCILAATPGPVGLAALAISRILKLPFHGTYHTAFPEYVGTLTGDSALEDGCWRYMSWFYNQMQIIYAPSESTRFELADHGIDPHKIVTYPRGVDTDRFHPAKRNGYFVQYAVEGRTKLLYVGRVSREKGLEVLVEAFLKASRMRDGLQLIVVGDGPYLDEMKRRLRGAPATFTGVLKGEALAQAYASSDLFVFPSATDTFGNVVLEAQASGLPVIVTDKGGPCENVLPNETGLVVPADDPDALLRAILHLIDAPERIQYMRQKARSHVEKRTFDATFLKTWEIFGSHVGERERAS